MINIPEVDMLKAKITEVFCTMDMPSPPMFEAYDEDEQAIIDALDYKPWLDVDVTRLDISHGLALMLLEDEWFHYYLPAYMLALLDSENGSVPMFVLLRELTEPNHSISNNKTSEPRALRFTAEQQTAVTDFIKAVS